MLLIYLNIREEFDNVAFIYVSDDMSWGTSRFKNQKNLYHFGAAQNMNEEARSGIADPDAAAYDLALMVISEKKKMHLTSMCSSLMDIQTQCCQLVFKLYFKYCEGCRTLITV